MPATIKDIAKMVGVNPSTVSRVINGTASISEETKAKITKAMKELNYHPNVAARSLVNGNTTTIALAIDAGNADAFSNAFFIQSVSAIERVSQAKGYNVLITTDANCKQNNTVTSLITEHKVDGIILPVSIMNKELVKLLVDYKMPFVVLGEPEEKSKEVFWVDMDNEQGSRLAVEHLLKMGYRAPALIVENKGTMFEKQRIFGYKSAICVSHKQWIIETKDGEGEVNRVMNELFDDADRPDSIICTNNIVAFKVLRELKNRNIRVPGDIGLITFDNYPLAEYMEPALTVVDVDTYKMGEEATKFLFQKIKNAELTNVSYRIPTQLIVRDSTKK